MTTLPQRPIINGINFCNSKLYQFSQQGILVASQWPDMRAWRKTPKARQWQQVRPALRLERNQTGWSCQINYREGKTLQFTHGRPIRFAMASRPELIENDQPWEYEAHEPVRPDRTLELALENRREERRNALKGEYLSPIPDEVLTCVQPFAERHWHLLNLVGRCPGALDLIQSTPALAVALSSPWVFRQTPPAHPLRSARRLLSKRQTDIAAWLGFPDAWSTVKILRKLPPEECSVLNLLNLRDLFGVHRNILQHLPVLNSSLIRLMSGERGKYQVTPAFIQEFARNGQLLDRSMRILQDTLWMREKLQDSGIITLRSFACLARTHDQFVGQMGRMDLRIIDPQPFSPPPFFPPPLLASSPYLELEPLQSELDLLEEGRIQRNCVGAYGPRVQTGRMYLYRILSPERATVAVSLSKSGAWRLHEIKAYQNANVMPATLSAVLEWIECAASSNASYECEEADMPF